MVWIEEARRPTILAIDFNDTVWLDNAVVNSFLMFRIFWEGRIKGVQTKSI